jgi:hypothetical protein
MKYLCLACVIGWSAAAHAATGTSPTVDVPITISSVCNNPAVPHPAQVAGFTTLAYCADFTTSSGNNNVVAGVAKNENWSSMSWLDCSTRGGGGNVAGAQWLNYNGGQPGANECGTKTIELDSASGKNALTITATTALTSPDKLGLTTAGDPCSNTLNPCYEVFPLTNMYVEINWRVNTSEYANVVHPGAMIQDFFSWWASTTNSPNGCLEVDFLEYWGSPPSPNTNSYIFNYGGCSGSENVSGGRFTVDSNYHTFASLETSNRTNLVTACSYLDGNALDAPGACHYASGTNISYPEEGYLQLANWAAYDSAGITGPVHLWVAWIRVWVNGSCWDTTGNPHTTANTCNTASPFTSPP